MVACDFADLSRLDLLIGDNHKFHLAAAIHAMVISGITYQAISDTTNINITYIAHLCTESESRYLKDVLFTAAVQIYAAEAAKKLITAH